jgi:hypothetical protein
VSKYWHELSEAEQQAACMEMKHELDRLNAELLELNDKAVFIKFENEDELPAEIKDDVYSAMFECSHVDGVRLFPYIEENGQKYFLVMLKEVVAKLAALKSENVNLSKKVTDYGKELRQSYKYDKTCSTCRYLDENRDCVLGIRCVNYTLWQGKI